MAEKYDYTIVCDSRDHATQIFELLKSKQKEGVFTGDANLTGRMRFTSKNNFTYELDETSSWKIEIETCDTFTKSDIEDLLRKEGL